MQQQQIIILSSILISSVILTTVICKPNNNNNQQQQNLDKQLLRKALDQERTSDGGGRGGGANNNNNNNNNGDSSSSSASISFQCPEQFGYYTDTKDCTKYYVCVFGEVLHESCTGGLRFSRELQTCDWPRNVDCPNQSASNDSSTTTTTTTSTTNQSSSPSPPLTTTTSTASTTTISTTSTTGTLASASNQPTSSTPPSILSSQSARSSSSSSSLSSHDHHNNHDMNVANSKPANKPGGSSSMVFADEGSDPQQPSFDEAVSPVITADGAIHLHDGSGGTFSLTPNHNRALQNGSPQVQPPTLASDHQPENMNIFVRPILTNSQTARELSNSDNKLANNNNNNNNRRTLQTSSSSSSSSSLTTNNNNNGGPKVLQAATLPNQRPQRNQNNNIQAGQDNLMNMPRELPNGMEFSPEDSSANNESENDDSPVNEPMGGPGDQLESSNLMSNENNDNNNNNPSESPDLSSDYNSGDQLENQSNFATTPSGAYNPPLLAPNGNKFAQPRNGNSMAAGAFGSGGSSNSVASSNGRQQQSSSQLISINNRQIVDPSRQTFKPILVTPSPAQLISSSQPVVNSNFNKNNNNRESNQFSNQRTAHQDRHHFNNNDHNQLPIINSNQRQNNITFASNSFIPTNFINNNNNNNNAQTNRQSRMSSNFQQNTNNNNQLVTLANQSGRFLSSIVGGQDSTNSNLNFNDSSKLIRLQASQNNQFDPSTSNTQANSPLQLGSNTFQPRFPAPLSSSSSSSSSPSSRSQNNNNILFSQQQPTSSSFGFAADPSGSSATSGVTNRHSNSNNNDNNNSNHNVPLDQFDTNHHNHLQQQQQQQQQQQVTTRNSNNNNLHQSASLPPLLMQQQQQRRPRPPKRHQIPSGGGGSNGNSGSGNAGGRRPNQLNDFIDATTSTTPINNNANFLTAMSNGNNNNNNNNNGDEDDVNNNPLNDFSPVNGADQLLAGPTPPTRPVRPIVASTTVNFQSPETNLDINSNNNNNNNNNGQFGSTLAPPPTATTTVASSTSPPSRLLQNNGNNNVNQRLQRPGQGQSNRQTTSTASSFAPTELPPELSQPSTVQGAGQSVSSSSPAVVDPQTNDPQLVANRYLNSAIDALEAGQPFGTVDYDFDILNDNSTERRNPVVGTNSANNNNQTIPLTSTTSNFNTNNRQRQQTLNGAAEGINLTNGQPSTTTTTSNGNNNNNQIGRQQQSGGRSRSNQQARQSTSAAGQQDSVNNLLVGNQQQTSAPSIQQATSTGQQQQQQPTKKPRPTNKKISVNHEQALANNRASTEPARRPEAIYQTPTALQTAAKCDNRICRLPDCKCGDTLNPGGLDAKVIPQVVLLTFDDAVNDLNWEIYEELFSGRTNPNGCPILATFYVSHEWTDYGQVQTLYSRGHEMASHSVTHSFGEKFSKNQWFKEINGQREILNMYGGVKMNDVRGMRAPFLQIGGNKMFEMLYDANFTYDSSMPIFENSPPLWPYTLDYQMSHECMITPCPTKSFPGVWEVGMTMWVDLRGGRCSMGDACSNPPDEDGVYEMLMKNFNRHYKSNRAPFGLFYHSAWFNTVHHRRGFLRFLGTVNSLPDVFFVTNWQMLQWMRQPTPISEINQFEPWQCPAKNDRPPPCFHPSVCNVKSEHGTRFMKTCQPCPANQQYPWVSASSFHIPARRLAKS